jgi:hypothetical protein
MLTGRSPLSGCDLLALCNNLFRSGLSADAVTVEVATHGVINRFCGEGY